MPNMEELSSQISRKIADGPADEIWINSVLTSLTANYGSQREQWTYARTISVEIRPHHLKRMMHTRKDT